MSAIETAREALLSQLEPIEREYAAAKERLDVIEHEKVQLEAALKALSGPGISKTRTGRKAAKPFARKQDVMAVCLALVEANQPIAKEDLESLVKHKLSEESGFNLSGVSLRLGECLASDQLAIASSGMISLSVASSGGEVQFNSQTMSG